MSHPGRPLVIAHRGASADAPENTAEAYHLAARQRADWVELDVRATADGHLIVNHDPWYRDGRTVWATPRTEVPTDTLDLDSAMSACEGMGVNIEIKNSPGDLGDGPGGPAIVDEVVAVIDGLGPPWRDRILVSSFDLPTITRLKHLDPTVATGYLVFDLSAQPDALALTVDGGHDAFHPWDPFVTEDLVADCRAAGVRLNTWTVDDPQRWEVLAGWGVDGIVTNTPGPLVTMLDRTAAPRSGSPGA